MAAVFRARSHQFAVLVLVVTLTASCTKQGSSAAERFEHRSVPDNINDHFKTVAEANRPAIEILSPALRQPSRRR